uniref:Uncharacterized protein n=1 Tax=Ditylenchus dipsaci TaxID=166011 RepID=A0A915DGT4_9BILA
MQGLQETTGGYPSIEATIQLYPGSHQESPGIYP